MFRIFIIAESAFFLTLSFLNLLFRRSCTIDLYSISPWGSFIDSTIEHLFSKLNSLNFFLCFIVLCVGGYRCELNDSYRI